MHRSIWLVNLVGKTEETEISVSSAPKEAKSAAKRRAPACAVTSSTEARRKEIRLGKKVGLDSAKIAIAFHRTPNSGVLGAAVNFL
jgi:hypothetical protein